MNSSSLHDNPMMTTSHAYMDPRHREVVLRGDLAALHQLIQRDANFVTQVLPASLNTVLHLAARFGKLEMAAEVARSNPELVSAVNAELETALHEACREGHGEIARLLLEVCPGVAYQMNCREESALYVACERGKAQVVNHLLIDFPMLLTLELDLSTTSLHVAASSGHTDIVKEILRARAELASKSDSNGCIPLHLACSKGHLEATKELLEVDSDHCFRQDKEGRTPLHWAAVKGRVNIIYELIGASLESAHKLTNHGETVLHLAVKNNQFEVLKYLMEVLDVSTLKNAQDNDGNTILHLATSAKLRAMLIYLLKLGVEVNALNRKGYTALDVVEADASNSGALAIIPALQEAGAKRCDQLSPIFQDIPPDTPSQKSPQNIFWWPNKSRLHDASSPFRNHKPTSRRRVKQLELQSEGLRNARKTITVVAALIATVSFAAGVNPPGGFNQETGKALRGHATDFKVFLICNIVALFLSLGIVNVHVSIIPFKRKSMMSLMVATHKVLWASTMFMAAAYISAIWTIMPDGKGTRLVLAEVVTIGGGFTMIVYCGLGWLLIRHWFRKHKWRKTKTKKLTNGSPNSSVSRVEEMKDLGKHSIETSSNSDVESSDQGYHLY
ncbi:PREDICTED: ankyrin repeat-containing protein At5g02620-like [Ipomoea nil]|uniref:ankyrin repeat-containing protein At5g02620-like n=1 Tax=Ipomoea nil TaxID=35883 RepID=UPI00090124F8|nr:PREDICTED: ankyrin repeat-containing protein At5g02620-like [Ipomoea nil]